MWKFRNRGCVWSRCRCRGGILVISRFLCFFRFILSLVFLVYLDLFSLAAFVFIPCLPPTSGCDTTLPFFLFFFLDEPLHFLLVLHRAMLGHVPCCL